MNSKSLFLACVLLIQCVSAKQIQPELYNSDWLKLKDGVITLYILNNCMDSSSFSFSKKDVISIKLKKLRKNYFNSSDRIVSLIDSVVLTNDTLIVSTAKIEDEKKNRSVIYPNAVIKSYFISEIRLKNPANNLVRCHEFIVDVRNDSLIARSHKIYPNDSCNVSMH